MTKYTKLRMKKLISLYGIVLLILSILGSFSPPAEKIYLRLNLHKNEKYHIKSELNQDIIQIIKGDTLTMQQKVKIGYLYEVLDRNDQGIINLQVTYKSVYFLQNTKYGRIEYDSEIDAGYIHPILKGYATLAGQSFYMTLDTLGKVREVKGINTLLKNSLDSFELPEGEQKESLKQSMQAQFGNKAIRENMEKMMAVYPARPVKIGDEWKKKIIIDKGFPMQLDNTWKLVEKNKGDVLIETYSVIHPNPEVPAMNMGGLKMTYQTTGTARGTLSMDMQSGWVKSSKIVQKFSGLVILEGIPRFPEGTSFPMEATSIATFTTLENTK